MPDMVRYQRPHPLTVCDRNKQTERKRERERERVDDSMSDDKHIYMYVSANIRETMFSEY